MLFERKPIELPFSSGYGNNNVILRVDDGYEEFGLDFDLPSDFESRPKIALTMHVLRKMGYVLLSLSEGGIQGGRLKGYQPHREDDEIVGQEGARLLVDFPEFFKMKYVKVGRDKVVFLRYQRSITGEWEELERDLTPKRVKIGR